MKPPIDDFDEQAFIDSYNRGEWKPVANQKKEIALARQAAANYLKKDARVNIRISTADLSMLKQRAAEEGMPYQTLMASVLHKFVSGPLGSR